MNTYYFYSDVTGHDLAVRLHYLHVGFRFALDRVSDSAWPSFPCLTDETTKVQMDSTVQFVRSVTGTRRNDSLLTLRTILGLTWSRRSEDCNHNIKIEPVPARAGGSAVWTIDPSMFPTTKLGVVPRNKIN